MKLIWSYLAEQREVRRACRQSLEVDEWMNWLILVFVKSPKMVVPKCTSRFNFRVDKSNVNTIYLHVSVDGAVPCKRCKIQQVRLFFSCAELPHFLGANTLSASVGFCLALRVQAALRSLYSLTLLFFLFWALKFSLSEKKSVPRKF